MRAALALFLKFLFFQEFFLFASGHRLGHLLFIALFSLLWPSCCSISDFFFGCLDSSFDDRLGVDFPSIHTLWTQLKQV